MDAQEYKAWTSYMKSRRGLWSIDPIHDGVNRDLIAFCPDRNDHSQGVFISISGPTIMSGRYEEADTHLGDALFLPVHGFSVLDGTRPDRYRCAKPSEEALKVVLERLGVKFLIEAICMA
jgi:hypothetical protein